MITKWKPDYKKHQIQVPVGIAGSPTSMHAPGTVLNDQFKSGNSWEDYLQALEQASPAIRAIGVTDYYSTETYERVCESKREGRLPACELVFPNIEMRLGIGTVKGKWVNVHLLVSPEDPEHIKQVKRFLARLTFSAHDDSFCCSKEDLIRLGRRHDGNLTSPVAALERGSEQFKVSLEELRRIYDASSWAQENILIAVAGSETDGAGGVRDAADATLRQEIEKFAHIMFASGQAQREFWLGRRSASESKLQERYGGLKPCMHGSDAHELRTIGIPDAGRYSWIKGAMHSIRSGKPVLTQTGVPSWAKNRQFTRHRPKSSRGYRSAMPPGPEHRSCS